MANNKVYTPKEGYKEALRRIEVCFKKKKPNLDLSSLSLTTIPPTIEKLVFLTSLDLANNNISNIYPLSTLTQLDYLQLNYNKTSDLFALSNLDKLITLNMIENQIVDISPLSTLYNLKYLNVIINRINDISALSTTTNLETFAGSFNRIADLSPLKNLKKLRDLWLNNNNIKDLDPIAHLSQLSLLALGSNSIESIIALRSSLATTPSLHMNKDLGSEDGIYLGNCPISDPPKEILQQGSQAILNYWNLRDTNKSITNHTGRVLLIGDGDAGKTTLKRKLKNSYALIPSTDDKVNKSTVGIQIEKEYTFKKNGVVLTAHLWDFGGQEEQHLTHQYFFGRYSLYVILVDIRQGAPNLNYWLRMIDLLGRREDRKKTTVILVLNEKGMDQTGDISLNTYLETYPKLELVKLQVNLGRKKGKQNDHRYANVETAIQHHFSELPQIGKSFPAPFQAVRDILHKEKDQGRHYFEWSEFKKLCAKNNLPKQADALLFTQYLHALGEVIHFHPREDEAGIHFADLRKYVIIDPEWATKAIYLLLSRKEITEAGGFFNPAILDKAWLAYSTSEQRLLKALLTEEALEVCFEAPHERGKYVAASLLSPDRREFPFKPIKGHGLRFKFHYPKGIPVGLVTRLIVRQSELLEKGHYYRSGAIFQSLDGVRARVDATLNDPNVLEIWVDHTGFDGRHFLKTLRQEVHKIHTKSFQTVTFNELIPCVCTECLQTDTPENYKLTALQKREKKNPFATVSCDESLEDVLVKAILEGVYPKGEWRKYHMPFENVQQNSPIPTAIILSVKKLIEANDLKEALQLLSTKSQAATISALKQEYTELKRQELADILSPDSLRRAKNSITDRLLKFLKH